MYEKQKQHRTHEKKERTNKSTKCLVSSVEDSGLPVSSISMFLRLFLYFSIVYVFMTIFSILRIRCTFLLKNLYIFSKKSTLTSALNYYFFYPEKTKILILKAVPRTKCWGDMSKSNFQKSSRYRD